MPVPVIAAGAAAIAARLAAKKVAQEAAKKAAKAAAANARGLKAANAKVSKNNAGQTGSKLKSDILKRATPARANRTRGGSLSTLKKQDAAAKADKLVSNLKNTKPLENVPKDVSTRFNATIKRLAAEEAKKKKK